jgi:hypothetical protein
MRNDKAIDEHDNDGVIPNPFDPARLRIGQRFGEGQDVRQVLVSVPVRKPQRQEFIRVHPDPAMSLPVALLELKADRQTYIVDPALAPALPGEAVSKMLYLSITSNGALFLWPVKLPDEQDRLDEWNNVAHQAAALAKEQWVRVAANMPAGCYDVMTASASFREPNWPDVSFAQLLEIAFKKRIIEDLDHDVLKRLRGEIL